MQAVRYHFKEKFWNHVFPWLPLPVTLPWGGWWLAFNDGFGTGVFARITGGSLDNFLLRFLKPKMTVFDVGAHQGYYTLLISKLVGGQGSVIAFEPSSREFKRLFRHLRINRCKNVRANQLALSDVNGTADFFLIKGLWTTRNSLHPPANHEIQRVSVPITTLDAYLKRESSDDVDLIKLDVEGAELSVLEGSAELLSQTRRPTILCELNDEVISWGKWGHCGESIVEFLERKNFRWFSITTEGRLEPLVRSGVYCGDYAAVPFERLEALGPLIVDRI
ncbi:MAG TPA: FkbM family methyltransferase [Nitrospiria bacterium]|jgi:FkbM family methyltransferase|nr:FkbM family methyltransferase [Nitrospiria bacterium]